MGGRDEEAGGSVVRKVVLSYAYVSIWIFLSFTVIIYNKYILDPKMYDWPFPISLTLIHMAFCSSLAFALVRILRLVDPPTSPPMSTTLYAHSVVPIGALYALSLWFSNSAYIYLSVSFIQMLKALMPVAVYSVGVAFKKESFRTSAMANMLSISLGVAVAAYGEARFDPRGVALQLGAVAFEATRLVLIQILLTSKGISLNPITSLYYVAPCCFLFLLVPWYVYVLRGATHPPRRVLLPAGLVHLRHQLRLRVRAEPGRLPAGREDVGADDERGRGGEGLAADRVLVVGDQGHGHPRQPLRLRHRLPRRRLLQPRQAAGPQGQGGREEGRRAV